jgi:hypothetical protein
MGLQILPEIIIRLYQQQKQLDYYHCNIVVYSGTNIAFMQKKKR